MGQAGPAEGPAGRFKGFSADFGWALGGWWIDHPRGTVGWVFKTRLAGGFGKKCPPPPAGSLGESVRGVCIAGFPPPILRHSPPHGLVSLP